MGVTKMTKVKNTRAKRKVKNTRQKGNKLEFDTQRWMKERGEWFYRVGMSGQLEGMKGDFGWYKGEDEDGEWGFSIGEAKAGNQVPKKLYDWLEKDDMDFLVVKRDRKKRLWIFDDETLEKLLK